MAQIDFKQLIIFALIAASIATSALVYPAFDLHGGAA